MDPEMANLLRADIAALRETLAATRQDVSALEAKADSLEAWRIRYLVQEDQLVNKLFSKIDEINISFSNMLADVARLRGERDAERRISMAVISLLSAVSGGLATSLFHG